jgi:hypothetical protein
MEISDAERRAEEAEALAAIYGDDFIRADECVWEILVPTSSSSDATSAAYFAATGERAPSRVRVRAFLPPSYPSSAAPLFELSPPEMFPFGRHEIATREMATRWAGDEVVYDVVERLRDAMDRWREEDDDEVLKERRSPRERGRMGTSVTRRDAMEEEDELRGGGEDDANAEEEEEDGDDEDDAAEEEEETGDVWDADALEAELAALALERASNDRDHRGRRRGAGDDGDGDGDAALMGWTEDDVEARIVHGTPFTEKKSTFQAHLVTGVTDPNLVDVVMSALRRDGKVARATHNIMAYRIKLPNGTHAADHDEDGESAAGGRLLRLLHVTDATDVCVVVTRWYGGIHLGPDRFKHINNAARDLLVACGVVKG